MPNEGLLRARSVDVVLHVGLHKTASSYVQSILSARRYDLLTHGVLYPNAGTGTGRGLTTRDGAQSGQTFFAKPGDRSPGLNALLAEIPASASTVLISAEDFTLPRRLSPEEVLARFAMFRSVRIVLVVRRQDHWIESVYKQLVDQYGNFETRAFDTYLAEEGRELLDFHARFDAWRELVGPEHFHAISYDDVADGSTLAREILEFAGISSEVAAGMVDVPVPRYDSVRAIDTLGLRILNTYRLADRDVRNRAARRIYDLAPKGEITLLTDEMRRGIIQACAPVNERIEAEWFATPVPGFRFAAPTRSAPEAVGADDLVEYVDRVIAVCEAARDSLPETTAAP